MTTVSRFSLAFQLLCFSRFDEEEYVLVKPGSHGIARDSKLHAGRPIRAASIGSIDRIARRSRACAVVTSRRLRGSTNSNSPEIPSSITVAGDFRSRRFAFRCERRISLAYGFASRQGETRNEYSEVISL